MEVVDDLFVENEYIRWYYYFGSMFSICVKFIYKCYAINFNNGIYNSFECFIMLFQNYEVNDIRELLKLMNNYNKLI